jgi:hypothetical protein
MLRGVSVFFGRMLPMGQGLWHVTPLVAGLLVAGLAAAALADEPKQVAPSLVFDIPEQPLVTALQTYSVVSGVAVLYESGVEGSLRSAPLRGEYTREAALKELLGKSDLVVRYARADAITLVDPAAALADGPPADPLGSADMALDTLHVAGRAPSAPDRDALSDYIGVIQQDLQQALQRTGAARGGGYRVGVDLWIDPSRTIRRTAIFRSTGDRERDGVVSEALQGLVLRRAAPERTPQPVRVMIVVKSM